MKYMKNTQSYNRSHFPKNNSFLFDNMTGSPKPTVAWFKNGTEIKDGGRYSISSVDAEFSLTIKEATEADSDVYKVTAKNAAGEVTADIKVMV